MNHTEEQCKEKPRPVKKIIEGILFGSRWILVLFYSGLIIALLAYAYTYFFQIIHLIKTIGVVDTDTVTMTIIELIDIVMIASLVKVMITGSYHAFIDKHHHYPDEKSSSGFLKIKIATSLIGVSAIHLLQTFMRIGDVRFNITWDTIYKQGFIHFAFVLGALTLAAVEYIHDKTLPPTKEEKN